MSVEEQASSLFSQFWEWRLINAPEFATSIGCHRYDNRLDEMSLNSYSRREEEAKTLLKISEEFQRKNISSEVALNVDLMVSDLKQFLHGLQFKPYMCPLNMLEGPQLDFPRLLSWMKKVSADDYDKIICRMHFFSQQIDETIRLLIEGLACGMVMHNVSMETVPKVLKDIAETSTEESSLFKSFIEKPKEISEDEWEDIVDQAKKVINDEVKPSYLKLSGFISGEYLPQTRACIGASSLPNGEEYYASCLKFHTTTDLTPRQVHDIGINEVARITQRMIKVKEEVNYDGDLNEFLTYLRTNEKFNFKDSAEIVSVYKSVAKQIEGKLGDYFHILPEALYEITPVPAEVAPTFPGAYYIAPPNDASRPGTFWINTYKPESRKKYEAVSLCLHEAVPGHHLQTCLTMESGSSPDFRRFMEDRKYYEPPARFSMNTGYVEGWGLYSEFLGEEMGLYDDPFNMFGRLSHEMLRACRLVVDTGIHAFGWSRDKAIKYMEENTASDMHDITSEIDRYITWPGQACGYKIGELKIKELREKAEELLQEKFDLKMFHHTIASMGGVPLNILEKQINSFIKEQSSR